MTDDTERAALVAALEAARRFIDDGDIHPLSMAAQLLEQIDAALALAKEEK